MDDVVLNKAAMVERCILRIRQEHAGDDTVLETNLTKQDSIVLNIQRACEAAIDLGMHLVRRLRLGIPQDSRDAFVLLSREAGLDKALAERLARMVGFRNVAVHDYQSLNLAIVRAIIAHHLVELSGFTEWAVRCYG
jgi:uncharacterized protein YutE (UPF0331/DUF86 family)